MPVRGPIRLDATKYSVVVTCTRCPWWRALALTKLAAWRSAAAHESREHPGVDQARESLAWALKHLDAPSRV